MARHEVGFGDEEMGCPELGLIEREGRDRTEEMRAYAEYLEKIGYVVTETSEEPPYVCVDGAPLKGA